MEDQEVRQVWSAVTKPEERAAFEARGERFMREYRKALNTSGGLEKFYYQQAARSRVIDSFINVGPSSDAVNAPDEYINLTRVERIKLERTDVTVDGSYPIVRAWLYFAHERECLTGEQTKRLLEVIGGGGE